MKYNKTLALIPAMFLAACGGGGDQDVNEKPRDGSMVYSFPMDGQAAVSPKTDIVLRFSHAVTDDVSTLKEKIVVQKGDQPLPFDVTTLDGGKSLKLKPTSAMETGADYRVMFTEPLASEGNREISTPNALGENGIQFATRGAFNGISHLTDTASRFDIAWQVPANGSAFQAMNFSTFRFAMTQPVHPDWKALGGSIRLLDADGAPVPATVLVKGTRITVDPCLTPEPDQCGSKQDVLNAGETYTLELNNLASLSDSHEANRFTGQFVFTPRDTGPTVVLQQTAIDSGNGAMTSVLNGQALNAVTLNSVLQGKAGPSQQTGDLFAELAYAPSFEADEALPLRIPKGSVLESTSLNVLVGGRVQVLDAATGDAQHTGTIKVTMLSDASGYMSPNQYTSDINAPRHITLFMDVSMNTEEAQPNAALSQDLMGVELRGIALVQDGVLTIDAIGMVEPSLLGQEYTDSTIAFHLQAATDADSVLDAENLREIDSTPPKLVSWMPGPENAIPATRQSMQRPGDPVILFFDEPLDPDSIDDSVKLVADGQELTVGNGKLRTLLDGTALTLNPVGGLKAGVEYEVSAAGLTDLSGNQFYHADNSLSFSLDGSGDNQTKVPPLALTTYPGYPCETDHAQLDLQAGILGKCYTAKDNLGDLLPVSKMPEDRPITIIFSQPMNLESIRLNDTFIVQEVDENGNDIKEVTGSLEKNNQRVRFYPDQPWRDGAFYQYTMVVKRGSDKLSDSAYTSYCRMTEPQSICGANGYPLKSDLLDGLNSGGSPDQSMKIYFEGTGSQASVFTPLRNLPVRDANADFSIDCDSNDNENCLEPFEHEYRDPGSVSDDTMVSGWLPSANSTKLSVVNNTAVLNPGLFQSNLDAQVGCKNGKSCPKDKFIYQSYALNTEVIGPGIWTDPATGAEQDGILVNLYPTLLATTSVNTYVDLTILEAEVPTNTQIIRMRYAEDPSCKGESSCPRNQLIPGAIVTGENGQPVFKTRAELMLDAPEMKITANGPHDLYATEFYFDLEGDVTFFDDGRMQVEQRNTNVVNINVIAKPLGLTIDLPLEILAGGTYLNFISNPVKDLPAQYEQQIAR
ncbi:Ig-like domain-containing protein [Marinobacter daepoensis]|uniref:Ig-like domain-containing protein n=1 Tax=Marinobacter daepoensis TaxID=262077 RepID=A0ABS3B9F3_9GAMM|nr:Ig-like domain-containing protein [Marinobacter daepoensis]MBN7768489.1 Ig-like domain-containing protein [Marinobacter daepoensis]MBY6079226.1 Ig-like domain-containing protein [Marinobacter daepoensis]